MDTHVIRAKYNYRRLVGNISSKQRKEYHKQVPKHVWNTYIQLEYTLELESQDL